MDSARNDSSKTDLVPAHRSLVEKTANYLKRRVSAHLAKDDLIQAGMIGLLEAAKQYNSEKGATFETYARIRIRGSILDEVRRSDWAPRSVYRNMRRLSMAVKEIENKIGRDARHREVADYLQLGLSEHHRLLQETQNVRLFDFEELGLEEQCVNTAESNIPSILNTLETEQSKNYLASALRKLSDREQQILKSYYQEDLNLKEIGLNFKVSESRISQIHSQALSKLQAYFKENGIQGRDTI